MLKTNYINPMDLGSEEISNKTDKINKINKINKVNKIKKNAKRRFVNRRRLKKKLLKIKKKIINLKTLIEVTTDLKKRKEFMKQYQKYVKIVANFEANLFASLSRFKMNNLIKLQKMMNRPNNYYKYLFNYHHDQLHYKNNNLFPNWTDNPNHGCHFSNFNQWFQYLKVIARSRSRYQRKKMRNLKNSQRFKISNLYQGPKSYDCIAFLNGNENDEKLVPLHKGRRRGHFTSPEDAYNFVKTSLEEIITYTEEQIFSNKIYVNCPALKEKRDKSGKFISNESKEKCETKIELLTIIKRLYHYPKQINYNKVKILDELYNKKLRTLKRLTYKQNNNLTECIFCIDPDVYEGLARQLTTNELIDFNNRSQNFKKLKRSDILFCITCLRAWCKSCVAELTIANRSEILHNGLTCKDYIIARDQKLEPDEIEMRKILKQCPGCKIWIERSEACNHIKCKCETHFCFVCGDDLTDLHKNGNLYDHFTMETNGDKCPQY
jgi:hypothetical protein